jgi:hypothetical protein
MGKEKKDRELRLTLNDEDAERLSNIAGVHGLTIKELLENFVADLVDGAGTNGSDERMYIDRWFDRCWFSNFNDTLLGKLLLEYGPYGPGDYLALYDNDDFESLEEYEGEFYFKDTHTNRDDEIKLIRAWVTERDSFL